MWRGIFGALAVLLYFTSVQLTGAGVGTLLNYTYPLWANAFGAVFLGQRTFRGFWALLALALVGVYLVIDPVWTQLPSFGELAGVVSAMLAGAAVIGGFLCLNEPLSPSFVTGGLLIVIASAWIGVKDGQQLRASLAEDAATGTAHTAR